MSIRITHCSALTVLSVVGSHKLKIMILAALDALFSRSLVTWFRWLLKSCELAIGLITGADDRMSTLLLSSFMFLSRRLNLSLCEFTLSARAS